MEFIIKFDSDQIKNAKNEEEESWALEAAFKIYTNATERIINPLIPEYNELWEEIDTHILNGDGSINEEAPYNKRHDEWCMMAYEAMSYIYGVNPETQRIVKLDYPYVLIDEEMSEGKIFAHIEDYNMEYEGEETT